MNQLELKSILDYDPDTGIFTWKARPTTENTREHNRKWNGQFAGKTAGSRLVVGDRVYCSIRTPDGPLLAHRLAWLFVYGEFPNLQLDHIDNNPSNNRISNLREATYGENHQNRTHASRVSRSGLLGVVLIPRSGKFYASITVDGKREFLGSFADKDLAHQAYLTAKARLHPFGEISKQIKGK